MVDGIERIGGFGGGREHKGERRDARPVRVRAPEAGTVARPDGASAPVFAPIAAFLQDVARLAESSDASEHIAAELVSARMLDAGIVAVGAQARIGEAGVRALLGPLPD